jgi:hypothetical protein
MSVMTAVTALLMIALSPTTALPPRIAAGFRRFRDDENGELVQNILWVAGFAAIAIAVIAIIRTFVLKEAQNLPTSDTVVQ